MTDLNLLIEVDCWNGSIKKEWERITDYGNKTPKEAEMQHLMKLVAEHLLEHPVCGYVAMHYYD